MRGNLPSPVKAGTYTLWTFREYGRAIGEYGLHTDLCQDTMIPGNRRHPHVRISHPTLQDPHCQKTIKGTTEEKPFWLEFNMGQATIDGLGPRHTWDKG